MSDLDRVLHQLASHWWVISYWGVPMCWIAIGIFAVVLKKRFSGGCLILAGLSTLLFSHLFADGSWFIAGWETDAPTSVLFSYKPWGYLAANLLPAISNLSLVLGCFLLVKNRG
jgi:hypothetical protein